MVVIFILTFIVVYVCSPLVKKFDFVPILLFGIWLLVLTMAGISRENVHPDEYVHIAATSYYADNWLPPAADDPSVRNTYSVYGFSRLNSLKYIIYCPERHINFYNFLNCQRLLPIGFSMWLCSALFFSFQLVMCMRE